MPRAESRRATRRNAEGGASQAPSRNPRLSPGGVGRKVARAARAPRAADGRAADGRVPDRRAAARALMAFLGASPSPFHAVAEAASRLEAAGFDRLDEAADWRLRAHGRYFITRNDSALVAFVVGGEAPAAAGLRLIGAHTDSPALKLKPEPLIERHGYLQLGVEVYGGSLLNSWLDRDLGLAGRVLLAGERSGRGSARAGRLREGRAGSPTGRAAHRRGQPARRNGGPGTAGASAKADRRPLSAPEGVEARLLRVDTPLARIPQLAIHLDREVNEKGLILNRENHLVPLIGLASRAGFDFRGWLGERLGVDPGRILDHDLILCDLAPPTLAGLREEFIFAPRLDNLVSSFCALSALIDTAGIEGAATRVIALYDNEEIGSNTRQGADGSLLDDALVRVVEGMEGGGAKGASSYVRARARSLLVSADMAHAVHPNYADRNEARHLPRLNGGPVIKYNANARYATDGVSGALFQTICREAAVPCQKYVNRADLACGSTIGPIVSRRLGVPTVDVGNAQLAMHSVREMSGAEGPGYMIRALSRFFAR